MITKEEDEDIGDKNKISLGRRKMQTFQSANIDDIALFSLHFKGKNQKKQQQCEQHITLLIEPYLK